MAVGKFNGIGKATEKKMHTLGIRTGNDLKQWSLPLLVQHFGKSGQHYYNIARGIDNRPVSNHRPSKSVGVEITFQEDIEDEAIILQQLHTLLINALTKLAAKQLIAHTLTIKIKYHNFVQITRRKTLPQEITDAKGFDIIFADLLKNTDMSTKKVRLLGVTLSSLQTSSLLKYRQLDLFD